MFRPFVSSLSTSHSHSASRRDRMGPKNTPAGDDGDHATAAASTPQLPLQRVVQVAGPWHPQILGRVLCDQKGQRSRGLDKPDGAKCHTRPSTRLNPVGGPSTRRPSTRSATTSSTTGLPVNSGSKADKSGWSFVRGGIRAWFPSGSHLTSRKRKLWWHISNVPFVPPPPLAFQVPPESHKAAGRRNSTRDLHDPFRASGAA